MTHADFLGRKATAIVKQGRPIPLDLFYQMLAAGIDVDAIERNAKDNNDE
jgi:hypothetical protein